jgi:hypothetical protein
VKALMVAAANAPDAYIKGFRTAGRRINLIMTLDRRGQIFSQWLDILLGHLAAGDTLPAAWVKIAPQRAGPEHARIPCCIFHAGNPGATFPR